MDQANAVGPTSVKGGFSSFVRVVGLHSLLKLCSRQPVARVQS